MQHIHPNILGNEVMNSLNAWYSAPCVKAYLNDLARYMQSSSVVDEGSSLEEEETSPRR